MRRWPSCWRRCRCARVGFEAAHLTVSRHRLADGDACRSGAAGARARRDRGHRRARARRKDAYEIATLREAARRLSRGRRRGAGRGPSAAGREREVALAIDWRIRAGRVRAAGVRDDRRQRAERRAAARAPRRAKINRRRPRRAGLRRRLRLILRRPDPDRFGRPGQRRGPARSTTPCCEAHDRAIAAVAPGASRFAIDAAARDALTGRGLGEAFGHGTGHGLGIEVHEDPRIVAAAARRRHATTRRSRPGWSSRSSRAPISPAGAVCGSKTMCW